IRADPERGVGRRGSRGARRRNERGDEKRERRPHESDYVIIPAVSETVETHRFEVAAAWSGDGAGMGRVATEDGALQVPVAGAVVLGGCGGKANPEELFLAAIASCFVNTWAIFLKKLALGYSEPTLKVEGELEKDPAGGFRFKRAVI